MKIVNEKAYYAFKNRLLQFNKNHGDKLAQNELLTEELFNGIGEAWEEIAESYSDDILSSNIENIKPDHWLSDVNMKKLLNAADSIYQELCGLVQNKNLGEAYKNQYGKDDMDYTRVAEEIIEIGVFALHAYTNVFDQCMNRCKFNMTQGIDRGAQFANAFYKSSQLYVSDVPYATRMLLRDPVHALPSMMFYTKENYQNLRDTPTKTYREIKAERDEEERIKEERRNQEKIEEQQRQEQVARERAEKEREIERKEAIEREEKSYVDSKTVAPYVENLENPPQIHQAFYTYFSEYANRMGIDQKVLNAQTLLTEIGQIQHDCRGKGADAFSSRMIPFFRQVRRLTFEAYVDKCIKEKQPIDLNKATNEIDDLMGALVYSVDPHAFNSTAAYNEQLIRASYAANGFFNVGENKLSILDREVVLGHISKEYLKNNPQFFVADGEAKYNAFTAERKSSGKILRELKEPITAYENYLKASQNSPEAEAPAEHAERSAHAEAELRKGAFDAAYALEKRVETRYASKLSRFFRYFSYKKQSNELAGMKKLLGVSNETRIADCIATDRASRLFVDASDAKTYLNKDKVYDNAKVRKMIRDNLEKYAGPLPEIDNAKVGEQMIKSANIKEQRELEKELKEVGLVVEDAPEKKESPEEEERRAENEQWLVERAQRYENERRERENLKEQARTANRPMYNQKLANLRKLMNEEMKNVKAAEGERLKEKEEIQARYDAIAENLPKLKEQTTILNSELQKLTEKLEEYSVKRTNYYIEAANSEENKKLMEKAEADATKGAKKGLGKQKLGNAKKISDAIEKNEFVAFYDKQLIEIGEKINLKQQEIETNSSAIKAIADEMATLKADINKKSVYGQKEIDHHYKVLDYSGQIDYMKANEDKILETGEGLKSLDERVGPPPPKYENDPFEVVIDYDEREAIRITELINEPVGRKAPAIKPPQRNAQKRMEK